MPKEYKDREILCKLYWEDSLSTTTIAKKYNVSYSTILNWMIKFDIERRSVSDANKGNNNGSFKGGLIENYVEIKKMCGNGDSLSIIANKCNISKRSVVRWLEKHKLKTKKLFNNRKGENNSNWKGGRILCECGDKKNRGSKNCAKCHYKTIKGENSPVWKGIADITKSCRNKIHIPWRKAVFERDNYTCQKCGNDKGGNLEAHHITRFSYILDNIISESNLDITLVENRLKIVELACNNDKLLSIYNGVTLCKNCHKELHKGKRKNKIEICTNIKEK